MLVLLSRIVSQLQNTTDMSDPSPLDNPFSPTASARRINVFWFLSLVLSLAAVLNWHYWFAVAAGASATIIWSQSPNCGIAHPYASEGFG
jgi:hypothetical protein